MPSPLEIQRELGRSIGYPAEFTQFVGHASLVGILDGVRTRVLDWTTKHAVAP
jgi:hypothetical protein